MIHNVRRYRNEVLRLLLCIVLYEEKYLKGSKIHFELAGFLVIEASSYRG